MRDKGQEDGIYYSVSEAVQRIGAPSHVLRYWEEELGIAVKRNGQGHRLYGESDVELFRWVKRLKENGIQLKAIRTLLQEGYDRSGRAGVTVTAVTEELPDPGRDGYSFRNPGENGDRSEYRNPASGRGGYGGRELSGGNEAGGDGLFSASGFYQGGAQYEIIPTAEADNFRVFETILRSLMEEVVAEQNAKLEKALESAFRTEAESLYLQFCQEAKREAAAAAEGTPRHAGAEKSAGRHRIGRWLREKFSGRR